MELLNRLRAASVTLLAQTDRWTWAQLACIAVFLVGVAMVYVPAAFIIGGAGGTVLCYLLAEADQRERAARAAADRKG